MSVDKNTRDTQHNLEEESKIIKQEESLENYVERRITELTAKVEELKQKWQEQGDLEAEIAQIDTILENFESAVKEIQRGEYETEIAAKGVVGAEFYEKNIKIDKVKTKAIEKSEIKGKKTAAKPFKPDSNNEDNLESELDSETQNKKWTHRLGNKLKNFGRGAKEVLSTNEGRKAVVKGVYDLSTTILGYKFATDILLATAGKGDLYNYFKQKRSAKAERGSIMESIRSQDVETARLSYQEKINNSKNLSAEDKKELLQALDKIMDEHQEAEEVIKQERDEKVKMALDAYLQNKIKGAKIAKDAMYLALTASGFLFARGAAFLIGAGLARAQAANQQINKDRINQNSEIDPEDEGRDKIDDILKDVFINSTIETFRSLRGKGKTDDSEHKTRDRMQAISNIAVAAGIAWTGIDGDIEIPDLLDSIEENGFGNTIQDNFIASAERITSIPNKLKDLVATLHNKENYGGLLENVNSVVNTVKEEGISESSQETWFLMKNIAIDELGLNEGLSDQEIAMAIEQNGGMETMVPFIENLEEPAQLGPVLDANSIQTEETVLATADPESIYGLGQQGGDVDIDKLGKDSLPEGSKIFATKLDTVDTGMHFEDTIDSFEVKGSDSIWRSTRSIFEKNADELGYQGDSLDTEAVSQWAETQTANAVAILNQEQGGNLSDLVHDGDKITLEVIDGEPHLNFEAASGIEASNLSDTNVSKIIEGQEFKEGIEQSSHIDSNTGDQYIEIKSGEEIYKIYDWDRDGQPNVIMPDGTTQEMSPIELQELLRSKELLASQVEVGAPTSELEPALAEQKPIPQAELDRPIVTPEGLQELEPSSGPVQDPLHDEGISEIKPNQPIVEEINNDSEDSDSGFNKPAPEPQEAKILEPEPVQPKTEASQPADSSSSGGVSESQEVETTPEETPEQAKQIGDFKIKEGVVKFQYDADGKVIGADPDYIVSIDNALLKQGFQKEIIKKAGEAHQLNRWGAWVDRAKMDVSKVQQNLHILEQLKEAGQGDSPEAEFIQKFTDQNIDYINNKYGDILKMSESESLKAAPEIASQSKEIVDDIVKGAELPEQISNLDQAINSINVLNPNLEFSLDKIATADLEYLNELKEISEGAEVIARRDNIPDLVEVYKDIIAKVDSQIENLSSKSAT